MVEDLESRQLLSVAPININFQPSYLTAPGGYYADSGRIFGDRGNGLSYGWNRSNPYVGMRGSSLSPDMRYDTVARTSAFNFSWSMALPNGVYNVHIAAGDPTYWLGSAYGYDANGVTVVSGTPTAANPFAEGTATVAVTNGRLTITNSAGSTGNAIDFIQIADASPTGVTATGHMNGTADLSWTKSVAQGGGFQVERSADGVNYSLLGSVGGNVTSYHDTGLSRGATYYYRVEATAGGAVSSPAVTQVTMPSFAYYDGMLFSGKPDMSSYGMPGIYVTDREMFANGNYSVGNEAATRALADKVAAMHESLVLDIENWPTDIRKATDAQVQDSINKLSQIITWIHSEQPGLKVGLYNIPNSDYWTPVEYQYAEDHAATDAGWAAKLPYWTAQYQAWQNAVDRLQPLIAQTDFVAPSLYTFYNDQAGWSVYAKANIDMAKRFGKPVVPFLCMYYHDSTALAGQTLDSGFWQLELNTMRQQADGAVVWGGFGQAWNSSAGWWTTTQASMSQ